MTAAFSLSHGFCDRQNLMVKNRGRQDAIFKNRIISMNLNCAMFLKNLLKFLLIFWQYIV